MKSLKRKLRRFWNEWGMTKEEAIDLLGAMSVIGLPIILSILGSILESIL